MRSTAPTSAALTALLERPDIWRGAAGSRGVLPGVSSGFSTLDAVLPGGGWPRGALSEILPAHQGIGELRLLGPALAQVARGGLTLAWIAPPFLPFAPGLAAAGIDLARIVIVRTKSAQDSLWATEHALRSNACGAVLTWLERSRYAELRRLQIAAEGTRSLAFVFRGVKAATESSPAPLRVALGTASGGLSVRMLKRRGGPLSKPILLPALAAPTSLLYQAPHAMDRLSPAQASARHLRLAHA